MVVDNVLKYVVRSQADLKGYNDAEHDFPPSVVDSSNWEPLGDLVKKLMRGGDVMVSSHDPVWEVDEAADPMDAIRNFDPTRGEGFDLADAALIAANAREVAEQSLDVRKKKLAEDVAKLEQDKEDLKEFRKKQKALEVGLGAERREQPEKPKASGVA